MLPYSIFILWQVEMMCWWMCLGALQNMREDWEVGDLLGESHILFRTLSLLTIHAITSTDQEHHFPKSQHHHPPVSLNQCVLDLSSYALPSNQALSISYWCGAPSSITNDVVLFQVCYGYPQHHLWGCDFMWGSEGQWGSRVQCPCGGGFYIIMSISTLSYIHIHE